jgi:DNA-binding transcriptional regulator YdaS (Cro superfamily)
MNIVMRVVESLDPPTQAELARRCGKFPQEVTRWVKRGRFPVEVCPAIEAATSGVWKRHDLRPDVFGQPGREAEKGGCG